MTNYSLLSSFSLSGSKILIFCANLHVAELLQLWITKRRLVMLRMLIAHGAYSLRIPRSEEMRDLHCNSLHESI